ncbi:MAG: hypothetical protein IKQ22_03615 [Clostridia bacterium]|nr:hypothetical protein [Clostridia bacterium]
MVDLKLGSLVKVHGEWLGTITDINHGDHKEFPYEITSCEIDQNNEPLIEWCAETDLYEPDYNDYITVFVAVMDYCSCTIRMYTINTYNGYQCEDIELWLEGHDPNFSEDQCYWMGSHEEIEVYYDE